jgi:hypothetical protein
MLMAARLLEHFRSEEERQRSADENPVGRELSLKLPASLSS